MKKPLFFAFVLCFSAVASAQVYRCVNEKGRVIFSDTACQMNHKGEKIMAEKSPEEKQRAAEKAQVEALEKAQVEKAKKAEAQAVERAPVQSPPRLPPPALLPTPEPTPEPTWPTAPTQKVPV